MHSPTSMFLALALASVPFALGSPHPQMTVCTSSTEYTVDSQQDEPGESKVGDTTVSGATGEAQLTQEYTYSVGVTVEVGVELGLDYKGIAAGVFGGVATTTETGTTSGVTDTCPQGEWYCSLSITPTMVRVKGKQQVSNSCGTLGPWQDYEVLMPKLGLDNNPIINAQACTCKNLGHWADDKHLALLCPGECALPPNQA